MKEWRFEVGLCGLEQAHLLYIYMLSCHAFQPCVPKAQGKAEGKISISYQTQSR
jgi:hypothetical protein